MSTLIILNPHAAGGKAGQVFKKIEKRLVDVLGEFVVVVTQSPEEVAKHLDEAASAGLDRLVTVGGDGTNHAVINALVQRPDLSLTFGSLPVGTGRDWARSLGVPLDPEEAVEWLSRAKEVPCDLGRLEYLDTRQDGRPVRHIFVNIASAGISGEVDSRVNRVRRRTSFTFLRATVACLFQYKPQTVQVECDGDTFYQGPMYLLAVANGQYFGRGMWVAPHALVNDGLFDVTLVEGMARLKVLMALRTVFSGKHLLRKDVHSRRAAEIRIRSEDGPLKIDLDGEEAEGQDLIFSVLPGAVRVLLNPESPAVERKLEPKPSE